MISPESLKSADPGYWAMAFVDSHPSIHYNVMLKWFKSAIAAGRAEAPPREPITIILEKTIGPNSTRQITEEWAHDDVVNAGIAAIKAKHSRKPEYHEIVKLDDDQCRKCGDRGLHLCKPDSGDAWTFKADDYGVIVPTKKLREQTDKSKGIVTLRENPPARTSWGMKTAKPGHVEIDTEGQ